MSTPRRAATVVVGVAVAGATAMSAAHEYGPPGVMFAPGSAGLDAAAQAYIADAAAVLARYPARTLCVEGHMDGVEARRGDALARLRATMVRDALRARGVPDASLGPAVGFAASRPLEGRVDGEGFTAAVHPRNRRVELRMPSARGCERP